MLRLLKRYNRDKMKGFTITELMIATSVFSVILLVGAAAFTNLGNTYYKGYTLTQTQQIAKQIINEVSANIRLSSSVVGPMTSGSSQYYCIGAHRYTFNQFQEVNTSNEDLTNFGLREDQPNGCADPFSGGAQLSLTNSTELLANNMRILDFSISPISGTTSYSVNLKLAAGENSALTQNGRSATSECKNQLSANRFCAVSTLSTVVHQGVST